MQSLAVSTKIAIMPYGNKKTPGFTLLEIMIATAILVIAISGLMATFAGLSSLNENSKKLTLATTSSQDKMEEIREYLDANGLATTYSAYNGQAFNPNGFPSSKGAVSIDNTNPDFLEISVSVSWRERGNRILGEDTNLNGALDAGEDLNSDGKLNSPAGLITIMVSR
ncbi:prepilin-type N-terminal cleavage/methylation domain-containing protein [Candidatus Omnitrophota bacterium]